LRVGLIQALGRMKKFFAYLMMVIGIVIAIAGLAGTPLIQDFLPINLMLPAGYQDSHHYLRIVPAEPQAIAYLPYLLLLLGLAALITGLILRRKLRGIAA
jgi:hypothetical protein